MPAHLLVGEYDPCLAGLLTRGESCGMFTTHGAARYVDIYRIVEQGDRDIARLFNDPKGSQALTMLTGIRSEGLLTDDELSALSPETRNTIEMLLGPSA